MLVGKNFKKFPQNSYEKSAENHFPIWLEQGILAKKYVNEEKPDPETTQKVHWNIKPPQCIEQIEFMSQQIHNKHKKHEEYDGEQKFFLGHADILYEKTRHLKWRVLS